MAAPTRIADLDLSPIPGKKYFNSIREWREEFIYFLLVDRFADDKARTPVTGSNRSPGPAPTDAFKRFMKGKISGITRNLDYILNLGCTSIWLSPIFGNVATEDVFHGYAIKNYLDVDSRFGTKADLVELVEQAHKRDMRVFLDVVINHMGNVFAYDKEEHDFFYANDQQFPLHHFRDKDLPVPTDLQKDRFFHRRGQIKNFDAFPETLNGDFFSLKDLAHDDTPDGADLMDILTAVHCYWIREADVDGFRMDAVKHLGQLAASRFASHVREYAYKLGKRSFLTFGELIAGDDSIDQFIGPNTSKSEGGKRVFFGIESVLDFPLYFVLPDAIKGLAPPSGVFARFERQRQRALNRGELGQYLVTFVDNHDGVGQPNDAKRRYAADAKDEQVIAGIGFLLCSLGTTCIYYGTEQGFSGKDGGDHVLRQPMWDPNDATRSFLNQECRIYKEIAKISNLTDALPALKHGRIYMREISGNGQDFGLPQGHPCTMAFSRVLADQEALVAYNTSTAEGRNDAVIVDAKLQAKRANLNVRYDSAAGTPNALQPPAVQPHPDPNNPTRFVRLKLAPMQFVVLE